MTQPWRRVRVYPGVVALIDGMQRVTWSCAHLEATCHRDERAERWLFKCPTCGCSAMIAFESQRPPVLRPCIHEGHPPPAPARLHPGTEPALAGWDRECVVGEPGCRCAMLAEVSVAARQLVEALRPGVVAEALSGHLDLLDPGDTQLPDAYRLDAGSAEAEDEIAAWREILDGAKGRRPNMPPA